MPTSTQTSFLAELSWRGLLHQRTSPGEIEQHLATPGRVAYCGFDPTSNSLTIGNFIQIKLLMHWQRCGHKPIVLMGGGTGLIGDPSGKDEERQLQTPEVVEANVAGQRRLFERLLDFDPKNPNAATIVNNADWLSTLGFIEVLRDVGKHFSVNAMIQKDSVRDRLHGREQGISYTEFSYMILQAYDFLHLYRTMNCTVQTAGSDQYGNIIEGIDLIRRAVGSRPSALGNSDSQGPDSTADSRQPKAAVAFGITSPLVKAASGKKIGKTAEGAVWLSADRTSPYAFYQYWINVDDVDAESFLKWFTFLEEERIAEVVERHKAAPHERIAQKELARQMTSLIHGENELRHVEAATQALFTGDVRSLDESLLREVFRDVPHSTHSKADLGSERAALVEILAQTSLANSKREAKEHLRSRAITVNGEAVDFQRILASNDLLHGHTILLRRGKKYWHATRWQ